MRPKGMQLSRRHRVWFYGSYSLLYLSGLAWIFFHYFISGPQGENKIHPLEPWSLKIHGAASFLTLIVLGSLIPNHMKRGWKSKINLQNGLLLIAVNLILIVTGYALYYAGGEGLRFFVHWIHILFGILIPAFIFWHISQGRKYRFKKSSS